METRPSPSRHGTGARVKIVIPRTTHHFGPTGYGHTSHHVTPPPASTQLQNKKQTRQTRNSCPSPPRPDTHRFKVAGGGGGPAPCPPPPPRSIQSRNCAARATTTPGGIPSSSPAPVGRRFLLNAAAALSRLLLPPLLASWRPSTRGPVGSLSL